MKLKVILHSTVLALAWGSFVAGAGEQSAPSVKRYGTWGVDLGGRDLTVTGDQRFFLSWAQNWQAKQRDEFLRRAAIEDVHAPPLQRLLGSIRNVDEWYTAFDVKPGDKYFLKPEERVRIW